MAAVRAAKKPPAYKNVCEYVKSLPDEHKASLKNVKDWERHNKEIVKELKYKHRTTDKGKEKDILHREIVNREGYLRRINTYFESGVWLDLFYGKDQENKVAFRPTAYAYDENGLRKYYHPIDTEREI